MIGGAYRGPNVFVGPETGIHGLPVHSLPSIIEMTGTDGGFNARTAVGSMA